MGDDPGAGREGRRPLQGCLVRIGSYRGIEDEEHSSDSERERSEPNSHPCHDASPRGAPVLLGGKVLVGIKQRTVASANVQATSIYCAINPIRLLIACAAISVLPGLILPDWPGSRDSFLASGESQDLRDAGRCAAVAFAAPVRRRRA